MVRALPAAGTLPHSTEWELKVGVYLEKPPETPTDIIHPEVIKDQNIREFVSFRRNAQSVTVQYQVDLTDATSIIVNVHNRASKALKFEIFYPELNGSYVPIAFEPVTLQAATVQGGAEPLYNNSLIQELTKSGRCKS